MEKLIVDLVAAILTNATFQGCSFTDDSTPVKDAQGNVTDAVVGPTTRLRSLVVDDVFQVWYQFVNQQLGNPAWPTPNLSLGSTLSQLAGGPSGPGIGSILSLAQKVMSAIPATAPVAAALGSVALPSAAAPATK